MPLNHSIDVNYPQSRFWRSLTELGALGFIFYIWMLSQSALAESGQGSNNDGTLWLEAIEGQTQKVGSTSRAASNEETAFSALQLETDVRIQVTGPISRVIVKQVFYNPSQLWVEGQYRYPLPESASVDRLRMKIGDREVEGQIQEKQQAVRTFAKARRDGKRASLLSHHRANQFRTQVTNIAPQEQVVVEFEYQQWLDFKDGRYDLRFPMVSSPAYTPSVADGSTAVQQKDFVYPDDHYRLPGDRPGNPVTITLNIEAGLPIRLPVSDSHDINVKRLDETRIKVSLEGLAELSDRDFLLSWQPEQTFRTTVSVLHERVNDEHYGLLMLMPPQEEFQGDTSQLRDLNFVLDVSGSMQGASIKQAKAAIEQALDQLNEDDLFNLIWFNTRSDSLFPVSQKATARNLAFARHKVRNLGADGGTNMLPALRSAFSQKFNASDKESDPVLRQVVFITDGAVSNEAELFTMIRQQLGDSRLFTVGIGSAPNSYFMRKAANAGRGSFTYINKPELVEEKVEKLFSKLKTPALTHVGADFQGYELEIFPKPIPDVYIGEPLYIAFKSPVFPEFVTVSGKIDGRSVYTNHALGGNDELSLQSVPYKGIANEWARRKIDHLLTLHREPGTEDKVSIKQEILDLGLKHHLVTKFTSLVAVDLEPVRAGAELLDQKVPENLPAGWVHNSNPSRSIQLAQTATGVWFKVYSGLFALIIAGLLILISRFIVDQRKSTLC